VRRAAALLAVWITACAGTETGNPPFEGELTYNTYSSQPAVAALRQAEGGARIDAAWLVLGDARFVDAARCEQRDEVPFHVQGIGAGDHATAAAARSSFALEAGDYCGLELPLLRAADGELPDEAPAALLDHSVVLEGQDAQGRPLRIESRLQAPIFLRAGAGSFHMDAVESRVLVAFDVGRWLDGVDLRGADVDSQGVVVVSPERNAALLERFEQNIAPGMALLRDPQGAGTVAQAGEQLAVGAP
jgi:hypothetical protein